MLVRYAWYSFFFFFFFSSSLLFRSPFLFFPSNFQQSTFTVAEQQRLGLNEGGREGVDGIQFRNLLELEACLLYIEQQFSNWTIVWLEVVDPIL